MTIFMFLQYPNPDLDDSLLNCFLESIANIQKDDSKAGDFNAHHPEWLNCASPTDVHGHRAYDCHKLIYETTHTLGKVLDLLWLMFLVLLMLTFRNMLELLITNIF